MTFRSLDSTLKINELEGKLQLTLERYRKDFHKLHGGIAMQLKLDPDLLKDRSMKYHRRVKLIKIQISQLLKILREDDKFG